MPKIISAGVTITGLDELYAQLDSMATKGAEKAARKGLRKGAQIIQAAIKERAPVAKHAPTGNSLPIGAIANDINIGNVTKGEGGSMAIRIGPGTATRHVATWVEYGHDAPSGSTTLIGQKVKVSGSGKPTPAYPFIRPAFEESQAAATQAVVDTIAEEVEKQGLGQSTDSEVA